ncbi:MAG: hypothetical protein NTZ55_05195 [Candidatus Roizmanbacteria bacterium]|nr:hypothetical protein [Candidatus Roizmanbacteria bacterium]
MIVALYGILLVLFGIYSYWLIDPNITFFQNNYWVMFRDWAVYLGYYRRDISWIAYLCLLILLFIFHFVFLKKFKQYSAIRIAGIIAIIGCISYPFVSHDLFNYLFDARILTHYGLNPYTHTALDFQKDLWTRFMHWTHRTYPYGPTFLPLTLIPSYLGLGKFSLTFFFYKLMNGVLYFLAVFFLNKKNRREALLFATHPLIIIEGLINGHNDMIAVSIGLIGIYFLGKKHNIWSRILLGISAGIKYVTLPVLFLHSKLQITRYMKLLFCMQVGLVLYLCYKMEIQPWYFLSLFVFIPFFPKFLEELSILFFGLLLSYYPFIRFGDWTAKTVALKREIVFVSLFIQGIFLLISYLRNRKFLIK